MKKLYIQVIELTIILIICLYFIAACGDSEKGTAIDQLPDIDQTTDIAISECFENSLLKYDIDGNCYILRPCEFDSTKKCITAGSLNYNDKI